VDRCEACANTVDKASSMYEEKRNGQSMCSRPQISIHWRANYPAHVAVHSGICHRRCLTVLPRPIWSARMPLSPFW
jgi:hypothetical protein